VTPADKYTQYAAECIRVAQQICDPAQKTMLLDMAEKWRQVAESAEKKEPSDGDNC
jgi:hypothetical protein